MSRSSNSALAVVRDGMWGFLLFAGAAWLTIAWSVLRLEPMGIARVAGAVILFGAVTEALRALAGTRAWWLNAAMAGLFAVTGVVLLADRDGSFTTPSALIGWYLMVRGAVDVAVATVNRVADRGWGLTMVLGVLQVGLGFFAASRYSRTAEVVVLMLGALALMRGVADLVASLILRETAAAADRPREKAAGLAGYAAGLADFAAAATARSGRARHRATGLLGGRAGSAAAAATDAPTDEAGRAMANRASTDRTMTDRVTADGAMADGAMTDRATAERDAVLALAGVSGAITAAHPAVGVSTRRDDMVAATMFTGPHHADGRDGGAAGSAMSNPTGSAMSSAANSAMNNASAVAAPPEAGTGDAGTGDAGTGDAGTGDAGTGDAGTPDATPRRAGRRGATRATRAARDAAASGTAPERGADQERSDDRERGDGAEAERGGGLAVRTARLFGRAGRDNR